jgi:hypothetical protein
MMFNFSQKEDEIIKNIEARYLTHSRRNIYTALEEADFIWDEREVLVFDELWKRGLSIEKLAAHFDRTTDDMMLLIMDRAQLGYIQPRFHGLFGLDDYYEGKKKQ